MGSRLDPGFGLLLPEVLFDSDHEVAQGATSLQSSYTQADPGPGQPVPGDASRSWRPQISGHQDHDCAAIVLRGGYPGQDRPGRPSAAVALKVVEASPVELDWIGWDDPSTIRRWTTTANLFGASADVDAVAACVVPSTQEVVLYTCNSSGGSQVLSTYDPRQETWSSSSVLTGVVVPTPICLAYDEEAERLLLFGGAGAAYEGVTVALQSGDGGASWAPYSRGLYDQTTLAGRVTVAPQLRRPWAMFRAASGGYGQFSSIDRGVSWQRVDSDTGVLSGSEARIVPLRSGGFLVVYVETSTLDLKCRRLGGASIKFREADAILIDTTATRACVAAVDADGVVYVFRTDNAVDSDVSVYRSLDEGLTWERYAFHLAAAGAVTTSYPTLDHAVAAAGTIAVVHGLVGHADVASSRALLLCGGWTSVESGLGVTGVHARTERHGYGGYSGSASINGGRAWYPADTPDNYGWTATVTGTLTMSTTGGCGMRIQTTAQTAKFRAQAAGPNQTASGEIELTVADGPTTTYSGNGVRVDLRNGGANIHGFTAILTSTTIKLWDMHGGGASVAAEIVESSSIATLATTGVRLRWMVTQDGAGNAFLSVAYREIGTDRWQILADREVLADGGTFGTTYDECNWGTINNTTTDAVWRLAAVCWGGDWLWGLDNPSDIQDDPWDEGHLGLRWGRAVRSDVGYPCPVPAVTTYTTGSPTTCPRLTATGGPARAAELTDLPAAYAQPFARIYPTARQLSPRRGWLGTSNAEHRVVWDMGANQDLWVGGAVGLAVLGSLARQVTFEYWTGGAWVVAGTLDLSISGSTSLAATRSGRTLVPRSGSSVVSGYLAEGVLVGGYALVSAGGGTVARPIARQSAGYWDPAAHQPVRIVLDDVDGTEDTTATVQLVAPSGVLVAYLSSVQARRLWRVRWPASQVVPGGAYGAGKVLAGRVIGVGADPGWDWTRRLELRRTVDRDRSGQIESVRQLAPPGQVWSYGWTDGLMLRTLRASTTPDYVAASGGLAIGSAEDAVSLLGVVEHALRSGESPCVLLPRLPSSTGTVWDPSLWRYGVLVSDSMNLVGVAGEEGSDELVRLDAAAFEEVR